MSPAAARVLVQLPRIKGNAWAIPGFKPNRHLADLNHYWDRVRERADLQDVRIHDIRLFRFLTKRHSFASRALALGESLPVIGKLLGHRQIQTTARHAHLQLHSLKTAAERVMDRRTDLVPDSRTSPAEHRLASTPVTRGRRLSATEISPFATFRTV